MSIPRGVNDLRRARVVFLAEPDPVPASKIQRTICVERIRKICELVERPSQDPLLLQSVGKKTQRVVGCGAKLAEVLTMRPVLRKP